jgi:predicted metalloprotease
LGIGATIVLGILSLIFGQNFFALFDSAAPVGTPSGTADRSSPEEETQVQFVSFVLDDAQQTWRNLFQRDGGNYQDAKLVLFRDAVQSGCGAAGAETGPFYCPADGKVYLDLSFFDELDRRVGAPGDFAQAYVIAHEIGHHVQNLLGTGRQLRREQRSADRSGANALSVRMELQADCYAGVWGHATSRRNLLDPDDVEEGLRAAAAIGDDRLQRQSTGRVVPESFTHGSSAQRVEWLRRGLESGRPSDCDTFN